jgi:methylmalonyl-CoA mutase N-terminal domain/subunit
MGEEGPMNKAVSDCAYKVPTEEMRAKKVEEVKKYKASRDQAALGKTVKALYETAKKKENVQRAIIDGVKAGMTMGEMTGVIRLAYNLCYDPMEMLPTPDYINKSIN